MTRPSDTDLTLASWLQDGPTSGPTDVLASALLATRSTRQRPGWVARWWDLPTTTRMAAAVVAAVLVVAVGLSMVLGRASSETVGAPPPGPGNLERSSPTGSDGASWCFPGHPGCMGRLAAGTYTAPQFGIGFTVPEGWMNLTDDTGWFLLAPQDEHSTTSGRWIVVIPDAVITEQPADCTPSPMPGVYHAADNIVTWLSFHPGLVWSNVTSVFIGGLSGKSLDLTVNPSWTTVCTGDTEPSVSFLTEDNTGGWRWSAGGTDHQHMTFLDDGKGGVIAIAINTPTADGYEAFVQAAAPIVNSFSFTNVNGPTPGPPEPSRLPGSAP